MKQTLKTTLIALLMGGTLAACATPYQEMSLLTFTGGHFEEELPDGTYRVGFSANGFSNVTSTRDFAMLRAAELTLEKGGQYFELLFGDAGMRDDMYWNGYGVSTSSKPHSELLIRIHEQMPENPKGRIFNAREVQEEVRTRQGLDS